MHWSFLLVTFNVQRSNILSFFCKTIVFWIGIIEIYNDDILRLKQYDVGTYYSTNIYKYQEIIFQVEKHSLLKNLPFNVTRTFRWNIYWKIISFQFIYRILIYFDYIWLINLWMMVRHKAYSVTSLIRKGGKWWYEIDLGYTLSVSLHKIFNHLK